MQIGCRLKVIRAGMRGRAREFVRKARRHGLLPTVWVSALGRLNRAAMFTVSIAWRLRRPPISVTRFGSAYGGWLLPSELLTSGGPCYCVGIGEDTSLEEELLRRTPCAVWSFDPTPQAVAHVAAQPFPSDRFTFVPVGVWDATQVMRFFEPNDFELDISHSLTNLRRTRRYFEAPCVTLADLMRQFGHTRLMLLKLNIEGAEWRVLADLLSRRPPIALLCVEFCQPSGFWRVAAMVRRLRRAGYDYLDHDRWKFTFAHAEAVCRTAPTAGAAAARDSHHST